MYMTYECDTLSRVRDDDFYEKIDLLSDEEKINFYEMKCLDSD